MAYTTLRFLTKSIDKIGTVWYYKDNKERETKEDKKNPQRSSHREENFKKSERRRYGPPR